MKIYEGVSAKVRMIEQKKGIVYIDTYSPVYKISKWLYILAFAFSFVINSIYILGATWENLPYITPLICTAALIGGVVCLIKKWHIPSVILTLPSAVLLIFFFPHGLTYSAVLNPKYYWAHLAPMLLLIITVLICFTVDLIATLKFKKTYNRVVENLYKEYQIGVDEEVPEDKWAQFLENYDPYEYKSQFKTKKEKNVE